MASKAARQNPAANDITLDSAPHCDNPLPADASSRSSRATKKARQRSIGTVDATLPRRTRQNTKIGTRKGRKGRKSRFNIEVIYNQASTEMARGHAGF